MSDDERVEMIARVIYDAFPFDELGKKPSWIPKGNSRMQDRARDTARAILALLPAQSAWQGIEESDLEARITVLSDALKSISKNTCCDNCQEAANVARSALASYIGLARQPLAVEALRAFAVHATYPVSTKINPRGYAWRGEDALDYAKRLADDVLSAQSPPAPLPVVGESKEFSSGSFLGYRDASGNEMHCANTAFCPHPHRCSKGCINPVARVLSQKDKTS